MAVKHVHPIESELRDVTKLKPKSNEENYRFLERLARAATMVEDDVWDNLSEDTQVWVNAAHEAREQRFKPPSFSSVGELIAKTKVDQGKVDADPRKPKSGKKAVISHTNPKEIIPFTTKGVGWKVKEILLEYGLHLSSKDILALLKKEGLEYSPNTLSIVKAEFKHTLRVLKANGLLHPDVGRKQV